MATTNRAGAAYNAKASKQLDLILNPDIRCPCCANSVARPPRPWTIEPCQWCCRPLALVRSPGGIKRYRLCNVIDLAGSAYGIMTMTLVMWFVLSDMDARSFAKAVTVLMFVVGSILLIDGALSIKTAIDRTWRTTIYGFVARTFGVAKSTAGTFAIILVAVGLSL